MTASSPISVDVTFTLTFDPATTSLSDLERDLRSESKRAVAGALTDALARVEQHLVATLAPCRHCGGRMRSRGRTLRRLVSVFGSLPIRRARYACVTCRAVRQPLDEWIAHERFGVYSRAVCEHALYLAAELSFERAAEVLRHVGGIAMSGRQIERVLKAESPRLASALGAEAARLGAIATLAPSSLAFLDGAPIPLAAAMTPDTSSQLGAGVSASSDLAPLVPARRNRRGGAASPVGRLRQLKALGRWSAYWSTPPADDEPAIPRGEPTAAAPPPNTLPEE